MPTNFLPDQYAQDKTYAITHNYLEQQFADRDEILEKIKQVVIQGDFTLGRAVDEFEAEFKKVTKTKYAIAVGSGTDALFLSLKALDIQPGDEVITTPFTFYATIGAIVTAGAKPVFVDIKDDYNINLDLIEEKITDRSKVILPVHWAGKICDMHKINELARSHNLKVIEDACQAVMGEYYSNPAGSLGDLGCFSFHPLKNLNVWGDGGIVVTDSDRFAEEIFLLRNHGLIERNECLKFGYNSRLDTIQAVVALHMLDKLKHITDKRIQHANYLDAKLSQVTEVTIPQRENDIKQVYHLYAILCKDRNALQQHLIEHGVDAKVHYPIPMHLQPAAHYLGYPKGSFPVAEYTANHTLSLPVHEFVTEQDCDHMVALIKDFYK